MTQPDSSETCSILTTYGTLCTLYYDLDISKDNQEEFDFYERYVQEADGPILEPMCGTGRFLLRFLKAGYAIDGFDASHAMLKTLFKRAIEYNVQPNVWQEFVQDLKVKERYALAFIPVGSFNLIVDVQEAVRSLKALHQSLKSGGKLVFEVMTTRFLGRQEVYVWSHTALLCPDGKKIALATMHQSPEGAVQKTLCRYALFDQNDVALCVEDETYELRFYDVNGMDQLLKKTGFKNIKHIKAFKYGKQADLSDEIIMYECTK